MHIVQTTCKEVSLTYKKDNKIPSFNELIQTTNIFRENTILCSYFVKEIQRKFSIFNTGKREHIYTAREIFYRKDQLWVQDTRDKKHK